MYAIIQTGGKQYKVAEGDEIFVEKLNMEENQQDTIVFDKVLALLDEDKSQFGKPYVAGAKVTAALLKEGRGKKIRVYTYRPKKHYARTKGHRQPYTKLKITSIEA